MDSILVIAALMTKAPVVIPPPHAKPIPLLVASAEPPEELTTCYQGRYGSCWTGE